jgi:DNA-binding CsgD family transcriptional regulator
MFDALHTELVSQASLVTQRLEGVAFFRVAKDLYRLAAITYVCLNIPVVHRKAYTHCFYTDMCVKQFMSERPLHVDRAKVGADPSCSDSHEHADELEGGMNGGEKKPFVLILTPRARCGETAAFGATATMEVTDEAAQQAVLARECGILGNYFHSHVLRINGYDAEQELIVSARELDCLKWTAAGKTAWEASVILGISERTVRFHLNMAREKLKCATTTQAVAKAVANQLIDI